MVGITLAYTAPVNPEGATPVLNVDQLWKGLERKVRYAHEFVPVIKSCEVLKDTKTEIDRVVLLKPHPDKEGEKIHELCKMYAPCKVDFFRDDASLVSNIIAADPTGGPNIYMTYCFQLLFPDIAEGDAAAIESMKKTQKNMAKMAVEKSIQSIREMVEDGRIV